MLFLSQNKMHIKLIIAMNQIESNQISRTKKKHYCSMQLMYNTFKYARCVLIISVFPFIRLFHRYHCKSICIYYFDDFFPSPIDHWPSAQSTFWQTKHVFYKFLFACGFFTHSSTIPLFLSLCVFCLSGVCFSVFYPLSKQYNLILFVHSFWYAYIVFQSILWFVNSFFCSSLCLGFPSLFIHIVCICGKYIFIYI